MTNGGQQGEADSPSVGEWDRESPLLQGFASYLYHPLAESYAKWILGHPGRWDHGPLGLSHLESENVLWKNNTENPQIVMCQMQ